VPKSVCSDPRRTKSVTRVATYAESSLRWTMNGL
jgi:hypothetical protein